MIIEKFECKDCKEVFQKKDYHIFGRRCKPCRNHHLQKKVEGLKGEGLAEFLLWRSCRSVFERVRRNEKQAYYGVKCSWDKPGEMKRDLMACNTFWAEWKSQSKVYEENSRQLAFRPTIDRKVSDVEKDGHYYFENLRVLPYSKNSSLANSKSCLVILIKERKIEEIATYETIDKVMKELNISSRNALNLKRDSGKIYELSNGYSVLIQTVGGNFKTTGNPLYKMVIERKFYIVDFETGKEYEWKRYQASYSLEGLWFNKISMNDE